MGSTVRLCIPEPDLDEWSQRGSRIYGCVAPSVTPISGAISGGQSEWSNLLDGILMGTPEKGERCGR